MKQNIAFGVAGLAIGVGFALTGSAGGQTATQKIDIFDDTFRSTSEQRVVVTKEKQIDDLVYEGTLADLDKRLILIDQQIAKMQADKAMLIQVRADMVTELNKLPPR